MATVVNEQPLSAAAQFDIIGAAYEEAFADMQPQLAAIQWIKDQIQDRTPARVLDVGCGTGRPVCSELAAAGHEVHGIDISDKMLQAARRNVPNGTFEKVSFKDFKPEPASFDVVTAFLSVISDVTQDEIRQYIRDSYSWVKPGGFAVYVALDFNLDSGTSKWMGMDWSASSFDADTHIRLMREAGFEIVYTEKADFMPKSAEVGLCKPEEVVEENHVYVYARKP